MTIIEKGMFQLITFDRKSTALHMDYALCSLVKVPTSYEMQHDLLRPQRDSGLRSNVDIGISRPPFKYMF